MYKYSQKCSIDYSKDRVNEKRGRIHCILLAYSSCEIALPKYSNTTATAIPNLSKSKLAAKMSKMASMHYKILYIRESRK